MKGKVGLWVFVAAAAILFASVLCGVAAADPPATWDYDDVNYGPLVEGTDWAILGQSEIKATFGLVERHYCAGVVVFRTYAWTGTQMAYGPLFGVFVVEKPEQMIEDEVDCAGDNDEGFRA